MEFVKNHRGVAIFTSQDKPVIVQYKDISFISPHGCIAVRSKGLLICSQYILKEIEEPTK